MILIIYIRGYLYALAAQNKSDLLDSITPFAFNLAEFFCTAANFTGHFR
jgi:hypothetical protein